MQPFVIPHTQRTRTRTRIRTQTRTRIYCVRIVSRVSQAQQCSDIISMSWAHWNLQFVEEMSRMKTSAGETLLSAARRVWHKFVQCIVQKFEPNINFDTEDFIEQLTLFVPRTGMTYVSNAGNGASATTTGALHSSQENGLRFRTISSFQLCALGGVCRGRGGRCTYLLPAAAFELAIYKVLVRGGVCGGGASVDKNKSLSLNGLWRQRI